MKMLGVFLKNLLKRYLRSFIKVERGVDAEDEVVDLLMSIISEEGGEDNETN